MQQPGYPGRPGRDLHGSPLDLALAPAVRGDQPPRIAVERFELDAVVRERHAKPRRATGGTEHDSVREHHAFPDGHNESIDDARLPTAVPDDAWHFLEASLTAVAERGRVPEKDSADNEG